MLIYVVRHGRTEANAAGQLLGRADPELDSVGVVQAEAIAASLPDNLRVVSSPLARTMQTAAALGQPVETDERALELDYGSLDLLPLSEVPAEIWTKWRADIDFIPAGGESLRQVNDRVASLLNEIVADHDGRDVALVTHVSPIKAAMAWALGVGPEISWRAHVAQASVTKISAKGDRLSLQSFNDVGHLS